MKDSGVRSSMSILDLKGISFKVIIIGQSNVGKTSLIHKYIHGQFLEQYNITVGVDFKSKTVKLQDRYVQLQIWDTCGQQVYKSVVSSFYRGASAVFLVYSVDNRNSFEKLEFWNESFEKQGSPLALKFLIGTKSDLQRKVSIDEAQQYMKKINGSFYIETSSFNGQNIEELFQKAAELLFKKYQVQHEFQRLVKPQSDSVVGPIDLNKPSVFEEDGAENMKKKKRCCH